MNIQQLLNIEIHFLTDESGKVEVKRNYKCITSTL